MSNLPTLYTLPMEIYVNDMLLSNEQHNKGVYYESFIILHLFFDAKY